MPALCNVRLTIAFGTGVVSHGSAPHSLSSEFARPIRPPPGPDLLRLRCSSLFARQATTRSLEQHLTNPISIWKASRLVDRGLWRSARTASDLRPDPPTVSPLSGSHCIESDSAARPRVAAQIWLDSFRLRRRPAVTRGAPHREFPWRSDQNL